MFKRIRGNSGASQPTAPSAQGNQGANQGTNPVAAAGAAAQEAASEKEGKGRRALGAAGSSLYRAGRHTIYYILLEEKENNKYRQNSKHGSGYQYIIVVSVGCEQGVKSYGKREFLSAFKYEQRPEYGVPYAHRA